MSHPLRIVSLCPSHTELVFDLGLGSRLVGRTRFCIHPAPAVDAVERVGGTKNPRIQRIIDLRPDLVLMNAEENRLEDAAALQAAGVPLLSSMPRTAGETAAMVREIAAALGATERGEEIADAIEQGAAEVVARRGDRRVTFAYLIWWEPLMAVSTDTFVSELLGIAGGTNVFRAEGPRYPEISTELLKCLDPELILLSSEPFPFTERHAAELAEKLGWGPLAGPDRGAESTRIQLVDGELLSWHGSRTPRGIAYAEQVIAGTVARRARTK